MSQSSRKGAGTIEIIAIAVVSTTVTIILNKCGVIDVVRKLIEGK